MTRRRRRGRRRHSTRSCCRPRASPTGTRRASVWSARTTCWSRGSGCCWCRGCECFAGISLNALAFAGALLVRSQEQLDLLRQQGPLAALQHVASVGAGRPASDDVNPATRRVCQSGPTPRDAALRPENLRKSRSGSQRNFQVLDSLEFLSVVPRRPSTKTAAATSITVPDAFSAVPWGAANQ